MKKQSVAIAVHGGAGEDSAFIKNNKEAYEAGLKEAILEGYAILQKGGSALDAVTAAVISLENNILFNAGRGSAFNNAGQVEMDASIMNGADLKAGATAMVSNVKNPVVLAREIMTNTNHVFIAGKDADDFAKDRKLLLAEDSYFKTPHQQEEYLKTKAESIEAKLKKVIKGTVGAVALDSAGNLASATSTGGTPGSLPGRIGDSCIIGAGCYANNKTCAVSGTGDGEFLITGVIAHSIATVVELKALPLQEACDYVVHQKNKDVQGDIGVISINQKGDVGISFNSERMHRAWIDLSGNLQCEIYGHE